jgi:5'-nucleotidase / UDP-sugar diphosphatase
MRTLIIFLLFTSLSFSQTQITILHVGDSHSHLDAFGPKDMNFNGTIGGIGKAATLIATTPHDLFLHAGDFFVGDLFFNQYYGIPELQILKQLGCNALTVGNHETDLGPDALLYSLSNGILPGDFPVLSANMDLTGYPAISPYISHFTYKMVNGVKIGIFGMTIPSPLNNPYPIIIDENIPAITASAVSALYSGGAQVVILLSHLGYQIDSTLAVNIPGINYIIGGHDHYVFNQPKTVLDPYGKPVLIMQAGSNYEYIGKLKFTYNSGTITFDNYELLHVDASVPQLPAVQSVISYLKQGIVAYYGDVYSTMVGTAKFDIEQIPTSVNFKDSLMGNLVTDAYRYKTSTDIGITGNGLINEKIYKGGINGADIFRTTPYGFNPSNGLGFNLVKLDISGMELIHGFEVTLSLDPVTFFLQVSGMKFNYIPTNPVGSRVDLNSVKIGNKKIDLYKIYTVTVNEGAFGLLAALGVQIENYTFTDIPEYIAIKDFIASLRIVDYKSEGRIKTKIEGPVAAENKVTLKYALYENYPNPFNPSTTIKFEIPKSENVTLKIYNSLGQELSVLVNNFMNAGTYTYNFNAVNLSSGVYFYVLKAGSYSDTKRMMLIK